MVQIQMRRRHSKRLRRRFLHAVKQGDLEAAKALLIGGADLNTRAPCKWSAPGKTALMLATARGSVGLVRLLLERGADVNAWGGQEQSTALMAAVEKGDTVIAQLLLDHGAVINATAREEWTALLLAVRAGDRSMIEILLAAGADANVRSSVWNFGPTPLSFAATTLGHYATNWHSLGPSRANDARPPSKPRRTGRPSRASSSEPGPENRRTSNSNPTERGSPTARRANPGRRG